MGPGGAIYAEREREGEREREREVTSSDAALIIIISIIICGGRKDEMCAYNWPSALIHI